MRIVVLEDDRRFGTLLTDYLRVAGYTAELATSIAAFKCCIEPQMHDLLIIDLGLPDGDGVDLVRELRAQRCHAPILVVTARTSISDRISGLDCGADDYLPKPFNVNELLARVRALLRRPAQVHSSKVNVGRLQLDPTSGEILFDNARVELSPTERRLLALLMRRVGTVVPKAVIDIQVNGVQCSHTPNAVEQLVSRLRKSLERTRSGVDVRTVRGLGYVLEERHQC